MKDEERAEEYQIRKHHQRLYGHKPVVMKELNTTFKDGAEFGYNKANEWHFVKDGKYPTDEKDVEVLYQDCDKINVYNCVYDIHAENWLYYNLDDMVLERFPFNVIAWKEIVLPELKEIE